MILVIGLFPRIHTTPFPSDIVPQILML
jgi:hypothetical protein